MMVAAALAWGTAGRNVDYASPVSLLRSVVERWPHGRAHLNLGVALKMQGDRDEALEHIRQAVPDNPQAQYVLGSELYDRGRFDEAIAELREFLRRDPLRLDMLAAHNVMGLSLASQGKLAEAAGAFRSALTIEPRSADLHGNLAYVLLAQNDFEGASLHYGNVFALTNLGIALAAMGQGGQAIEEFRRALAIDPNNAEARKNLAGAQGVKDTQVQ